MDEYILANKNDLKNVSERTRTLKISCSLKHQDAADIMKRCRLLEEIIFDHKAFGETEDSAKEYLNKWVFVDTDARLI
ncbi:MAG: hypothetical protein ABIG20_05100 [archaeon]